MRSLKVALAFLTRLPVRIHGPVGGGDLAAAVPAFPLVGALVGLAGGLVFTLASLLNLPPLPAAVLALAAQVALTGALHEDGLADTADGLGGRTPEERLRIMRDSRIGSFGVIALTLALLARLAALASLAEPLLVGATLVAAGAFSRGVLPAAMATSRLARPDGLAAAAGRPSGGRALVAGAVVALLAFALLPPGPAVAALLVGAAAAAAAAAFCQAWLGGYTGDTLGAVQQAAEIAFMFAVIAAL